MRNYAIFFCLLIPGTAVGDFGASFVDGFVEIQGSSTFNAGFDNAAAGFSVGVGTTVSDGSGSTSTGGIFGGASYSVILTNTPNRIRLEAFAEANADAILEDGDNAFVTITIATDNLNGLGGRPLVMRLTSDTGPMPFTILEDSSQGLGSFSIDPPLQGGMIAPGDYNLRFNVGTFLSLDQPGLYGDFSEARFTMEIAVPEPTSTILGLCGVLLIAGLSGLRRN